MSERRILLLGATGFTGRQTLSALLSRGITPTLIGRDLRRLRAVSESVGTELPIVEADVTDEAALRAIIDADDVVVSTVGPFVQLGQGVARVAARTGAHYLDSTGEPPFVRWAFDELNADARSSGAAVVPAFGYDYVPGNLAGALAVTRANGAACHVDVGYFLLPGVNDVRPRGSLSDSIRLTTGATHASLVGVVAEPSFAYRRSSSGAWNLRTEMSALRLRRFPFAGQDRPAVTVGGSEHFGLPQSFPELESVDVHLGWFANWSRAVQVLSRTCGPLLGSTTGRRAMTAVADRLPTRSFVPTAQGTSLVTATTYDAGGQPISSAALAGPEPYELTAELLAFGAIHAANNSMPAGVQGPIAAFGLDTIESACRQIGLIDATAMLSEPYAGSHSRTTERV